MRGIALAVIGFLLLIAGVQAGTPNVHSVSTQSTHYLQAGTSTDIACNAIINDTDGYQDITAVSAVFYDQSSTTKEGDDDNNDHYTNSSCLLQGGSGNTTNATCSFPVAYYANPSQNWTCSVTASDGVTNMTNSSAASTVEELQALLVTSITYETTLGGPLMLGSISMEKTMTITNHGNVGIGIDLSGESMGCDIGRVNITNQKYSKSSSFSYASGTSLTTTPTTVDSFTIQQRTDDATPSTGSIYWLLQLPINGVGGVCNGNIYVDAR